MKLRTADPLHQVVGEAGEWRWYQPETGFTAPCNAAVNGVLTHFRGAAKEAESYVDGDGVDTPGLVGRLVAAGFLEADAAPPRPHPDAHVASARLGAVSPTLFNVPAATPGGGEHVVILGAPYAGGGPRPEVANAPAALRSAARTFIYQVDAGGLPVGFFDVRARRRILQGATLADAGDLTADGPLTWGALAPALAGAARRTWESGALPVVLGGDHSITLPVLTGMPWPACQVLHIDAHLDLDRPPEGGVDHASVMYEVARLPSVRRIVQVGVRGVDDARFERRLAELGDNVVSVPAMGASEIGEAVRRVLDPTLPCYVTFDVDAVDASLAPGTHHAAPGGLDLQALVATLHATAASVPVIGLDVVELLPDSDPRGITIHASLLAILALLDAWWTARHRLASPS